MNSFKTLELIFTIPVWAVTVILVALLIYQIYKTFIKKTEDQSIARLSGNWFPRILKILFGFSMLLALICVPFYGFIASPFKSMIPGYLNNLFLTSMVLLAGLECFRAFRISEKLLHKTYKKVGLTIIVVIIFPLSIYLIIDIPTMFTYPSKDDCHMVELPVKGKWLAQHAGGAQIVNRHFVVDAQKYSIDIVKINEKGQYFKGEGKQLDDFFTMGENIFSPVKGRVMNVVDSLPSPEIDLFEEDTLNPVNPAGNHVVIKFKPDRYVFLAHLDKGSVKVKEGEQVKTGDLIGLAGNSGNSTDPHLHMHIQDKPVVDNKNATGFPFRFKNMEIKRWLTWNTVRNDFLLRNDLFKESS